MIHHLMFFWFRKDSPQAEVEEVLEGIQSFATIPAVKDVSISENRGFPESCLTRSPMLPSLRLTIWKAGTSISPTTCTSPFGARRCPCLVS